MKSYTTTGLALLFALGLATSAADVQAAGDQAPEAAPTTEAGATPTSPALPESTEAGDAATPPEATAEAGSTVCPPGQECPTEEMTFEQERATGDTSAVDEDAEEEEASQ